MKIAPEAPKIVLGASGHAVLKTYLSLLVLGGHVGLPLALFTMLISHTASRRYPTLINMLVSWVIYATATLLLFYSGEYQNRQPDFGLCLAQASLVYGGTVMVGAATLCLVLQLWFELRGRNTIHMALKGKILLVAIPWLSFVIVAVLVAIYGSLNTSRVSYRWLFYCTISSDVVIRTVSGLTLLELATMFCFEVQILRTLYKASRQIRAMDRSSYNMSLRVLAFATYTLITFIIAGINLLIPDLIFPYVFISTLPLTAFAIFGTTQDNVTVWMNCLRPPRLRRNRNVIRLEPIAFGSNHALDSSGGMSSSNGSDRLAQKDVPPASDSVERLAPRRDPLQSH